MKPFLLACGSRNAKFAGSGIVGLQRLVVANALPKDMLAEVLEAFRECTTLALDIQLKVLQALPSLLQNYAGSLTGTLLLVAFQVCFLLYSSKTGVVSNTAAAALQQLVNSTFEKSAAHGKQIKDESMESVSIGDGTVSIGGAALDAYRLLDDICLLTDGQRPKYLQSASLAQNFGLELLETVLTNHTDTITSHHEQIHSLRLRLMPLMIRVLSEKAQFSTTVRAMRLLRLIISRLLFALGPECEMALSLLNHMLDPDAASIWKRALCLEVFRGIHAEPALVRNIYSRYDRAEEKRNIVRDHLGSLVRLASEKPSVIGLGQQSSIPSASGQNDDSGEQAAAQVGGLVGSIGASTATTDYNRSGISTQWSTVRVQCIDLLDKSEAPNLPATYIYGLALSCVTTFSEGLARFLMPFTVPNDGRPKRKQNAPQEPVENGPTYVPPERKLLRAQSYGGRRTSINPLDLKDHALYSQISTSGHMVEHCWPALLAVSSTYLNAALDSENYHSLIRSFQKFTQIAGLLDLTTPRDAFLTILGKHAVPALNSSLIVPENNRRGPAEDFTDGDSDVSPTPSLRRQSVDRVSPQMNTRHLLCLRALINLGIALGPVLRTSWAIILETLLQADLLLSMTGQAHRQRTKASTDAADNEFLADKETDAGDLGLEITAAETAASRLFEATADLPDEAFLEFLRCLCVLLRVGSQDSAVADGLLSPQPAGRKHQKVPSVSNFGLNRATLDRSNDFVIDKIREIIESNIVRLLQPATSESGWDILLEILNDLIKFHSAGPDLRLRAANTLNGLLVAAAISEELVNLEEKNHIRARSLDALLNEVLSLRQITFRDTRASQSCDDEVHRLALESLKSILEHCGDTLSVGWSSVLTIIDTIFTGFGESPADAVTARSSSRLTRSAFDSLQLICSDFLDSVPTSQLLVLLDTLYSFCAQHQDLNISLTTATFFRNVSDYLQSDDQDIVFDSLPTEMISDLKLVRWIKDTEADASAPALWLYLLLRLEQLASDDRAEVRHSSLHTLFRIFDACFDRIVLSASEICFNLVLVKLFRENQEHYLEAQANAGPDVEESLTRSWNETAIVEIVGTSELCSQWLESHKQAPVVVAMCQDLLRHFVDILKRHTLTVSKAVFTGSTKLLESIEKTASPEIAKSSILANSWEMWETGNPASHEDDSEKKRDDNQDTLASYLGCLHILLRLTADQLSLDQTKSIVAQLWLCVVKSSATAYTTDLDRMTTVQTMVLDSLALIPTVNIELVPILSLFFNRIVGLSYQQQDEAPGSKQTFIALSKAAMGMSELFLVEHIKRTQLDRTTLVVQSGKELNIPISLKYSWKLEGKGLSPWRKATLSAIAIFEAAIPFIQGNTEGVEEFWNIVVTITESIVSADCAACDNPKDIPNDRDFDIEAFSRIRRIVIPALGSSSIPDTTRRMFAESIFKNSLIHEPNIDDLARPGQELLEGLRSTHIGRVKDLPPSPRSKLSYLLLDELFDLVRVHDGSSERIKLAQAAAPYLILRAGLTLKAYIMDHPLRGRMPQPYSQKKEMMYILRKLVELDSEPKAVPAAPGVTSEHKKHLHRLYGLVMKALKVAWRDEEMMKALQDVLDAVGDDFGI